MSDVSDLTLKVYQLIDELVEGIEDESPRRFCPGGRIEGVTRRVVAVCREAWEQERQDDEAKLRGAIADEIEAIPSRPMLTDLGVSFVVSKSFAASTARGPMSPPVPVPSSGLGEQG